MKKAYLVVAAFAAAPVLTSCGTNDNTDENSPVAVRFSAGEAEVTAEDIGTRVAGDVWEVNDPIGVFMIQYAGDGDESEDILSILADNKKYTVRDGAGNFEAAGTNKIYYPMSGSDVSFVAYYPYDPLKDFDTDFDIVIGNQESQRNFDLLYSASAKGYNKKNTGAVPLTFTHKLSKLVMNCTAGAGVSQSSLKNMSVEIKGLKTRNTFNLRKNRLGEATGEDKIIPRVQANGSTYDAIVLPGKEDDAIVVFTLDSSGDIFIWPIGSIEFESGKVYTYIVTLNRTGVDASGTIKPWSKAPVGEVVAE